MPNPIVLVHGYSDEGASFQTWKSELIAWFRSRQPNFDPAQIRICSYRTLTNEVTIKDIAEGFDRALRECAGLNQDEDFDAIVHSTGMLVIRSWLVTYPRRKSRLKRLIGLAPATFGSPLAEIGRSTLGSLFKGNKQLGPDFMEAGDLILDGLELGSRFTWDLAHQDMIVEKPFYGPSSSTPYVFTFCGNKAYTGFRAFVNKPGTDGTVRWAGCALNSRKIRLDLTTEAQTTEQRLDFSRQENIHIPVVLVDGLDHSTILSKPSRDLVEQVGQALLVDSRSDFETWLAAAQRWSRRAVNAVDKWQQFVVRAVDERGDGIADYHLQLKTKVGGKLKDIRNFDLDVHRYRKDTSYRSFHVNLSKLKPETLENLVVTVIASTGTRFIGYLGHDRNLWTSGNSGYSNAGIGEVNYDVTGVLKHANGTLFYPFTTTLLEIVLNREPLPLTGDNDVCWFLKS